MKDRGGVSRAIGGSRMPCESCAVQFSVFRRKRICGECERCYCSGCLRRGGGAMCAPCRVLSTRPLHKHSIAHLKVRDLQCFLQRQNVSTRGCVEKEELLNLCVAHVNSNGYHRRGPRGYSPFNTLKGFTNNINEFINSALDLRGTSQPSSQPQSRNCYNSSHSHRTSPNTNTAPNSQPQPERFITNPGGERGVEVHPPEATSSSSRSTSTDFDRRDTADCYEIEDLDDSTWEFVPYRPADPLPNDSDVLLSATESPIPGTNNISSPREERPSGRQDAHTRQRDTLDVEPNLSSRQRASSELELHRSDSAHTNADTASLQDEPLMDHEPDRTKGVSLEQLSEAELERLSVRQLKELLARNRVEFRGCLERSDLLARARLLLRESQTQQDVDRLPLEECCKICMAAPLECVLLECGHIAACTACAKQLAECPICRQYVVRAVRFFRS